MAIRVTGGVLLDGERALRLVEGRGELDPAARFVVLGLEGPGDVDPAVAAQALAVRHPTLGVVVAVGPSLGHPYNVARRILSLDHLTGGRVGVALTGHAEFGRILAGLWATFPRDAVVTDRANGRFAESGRIRRLDYRGAWDVRGPLTTPSSVHGRPPILWAALPPRPSNAPTPSATQETALDADADAVLEIGADHEILSCRPVQPTTRPVAESSGSGTPSAICAAPAGTLRHLLGLPLPGDPILPLGEPAFESGGTR
jgi:hypothetical protein